MGRPSRPDSDSNGAPGALLAALAREVRERGAPDAQRVVELAREHEIPDAQVRAILSFYGELHRPHDAIRVCRGTSCVLAGAAGLTQRLGAGALPVYCLGYCDRSPVALTADGRVIAHARAAIGREELLAESGSAASLPEIRTRAPRAVVTERVVDGDHSELANARAAGVYAALASALRRPPEHVLREVELSGERGRGGAGFPTARKWRRCAEAPAERRYVIANGDEGDPGSFVDRVLMEHDPHAVLEGLALCAYAVSAHEGIVFIRSEYPGARARMEHAIETARTAGLLGPSVLESGFAFDVTVVTGLGSYVCGEETALLNAIEGRRGEVRLRPPYPAVEGLHGLPTVVNNVETLVNVPWIVRHGAAAYRALGTASSPGTKVLCLNQGFARPGLVEVEFGVSLRDVIEELGGGGRDGSAIDAVALGGPMGSVLGPDRWDVPVCYGAMSARGIALGHGGLVAVPHGTDYRALVEHWLEFMATESCGRCVPCSVGSKRALEIVREATASTDSLSALASLLDVMEQGSLCAFGQLVPGPVRDLIALFGDRIFEARA